ncbi:hypothetical protein EDD76_102309 [Kineothrix alysoides]|uniref:Uncharacterized protein n=1 Tax=Kineothrix alysoides TaxID=1469948 RepID=A0A4R1R590_9FIRM|nr:hypothetical protein [Kineothrix alysoides]TCL60610.1 hypothetical protein EDD76_102309 [Kineothrix alysoides]
MERLKDYDNLYLLYCRSRNKVIAPFFFFLILFVLAFATFLVDGFPFELTLVMMGMIFPAILLGIIWPIFSIRMKKSLKAFSPQQLHIINNEILSNTMYEKLLVTSQAVVSNKLGLVLVPIANIVWVYTEVVVDKLEDIIPLYKQTSLIIACRDRKKYIFRIKNNGKAFQFIQEELLRHRQDIVFVNERGMEEIYKNDINRMIAFGQECARERQKKMQESQL